MDGIFRRRRSFVLTRFPTQWKDKRDVAVQSTNCSPKEPHVTVSASVCSARKTGESHRADAQERQEASVKNVMLLSEKIGVFVYIIWTKNYSKYVR